MAENHARDVLVGAIAVISAAWIFAIVACLDSETAQALPIYAERTGLPCGQCHIDPHGGGPRTAFGRAFAANGHRLSGQKLRRGSSDSEYGYRRGMMRGYGPGMMGGYRR
jgi:hypothetical protein